MKNIMTFLIVMLITLSNIYSAYFGGEISCKSINNYTYQINVIVFKTYAPTDSVEVVFGDGTTGLIGIIDTVAYSNGAIYRYQGLHTFPGAGTYTLYSEFYNWADGYANIPNSSQVPFSLSTTIKIELDINTTPIFNNNILIDTVMVGQTFTYNPSVYDIEGDSISFELTDCIDVISYTLPDTLPYFFIDSESGNIQWNNPLTMGKYAVAFTMKEWRNGVIISRITKQMTIIVLSNSFIEFDDKNNYVNIYPNPTTGKIKIDDENIKNVYVINEFGKAIVNYKNSNEIDIKNLPKGIYFIKILTNNQTITRKLIKQ